ncbi:hypothetical protein GmHk_U059836 [Glycine max]|nr:hypothetical protein GmHk_U059836 [Glycine max]
MSKKICKEYKLNKNKKDPTIKRVFFLFFRKNENNFYKIDEEKYKLGFVKKPLVNILFNYKRWNRPFRYIKNNRFENVVKNEISEFFFHTCQSDGKERISFMYPPNLSTFHKMMETKFYLFTKDKISYDELSNYWSYTNEEKRNKLSNEFVNRAKVMDKELISLDILENRIRLSNDETKTKYLTKIYDPFLNGRFRGQIENVFSTSIQYEKNEKKNTILINKIHGILISNNTYKKNNSNYPELEKKINIFDRKSLVTTFFFFNLISKFSKKLVSSLSFEALSLFPEHEQVKINYEEEKKQIIKILFDAIRTDLNEKTIVNGNRTKCIRINEIRKKVPRWSYKFIDELEQLEGKNEAENYQIRSRKAKRVLYRGKGKRKFEKEEEKKENEERKRIEIAEAWDSIIFAQVIRDFRDWKREMYIKCTYNGVQLSEREFPKKWLTDGIQIKILFPFRLKPWHKSKLRSNEKKKDLMKKKNFCFLTVWGMEVDLPFSGSPKNRFSSFDPIFKELKTKQFQFFTFRVLKVLMKIEIVSNYLNRKSKKD